MRVYAVLLNEPAPDIKEQIEKQYTKPNHYKINDTAFFIQTNKLADDVAQDIGLKGENQGERVFGVVIKLNSSYSGFNLPALWDWLKVAEGKE